ncbi:DUF6545 domain-containing protein [Nocardia sp. NBC_00403]|uniref:DUF6545 domain-containing protein n=1 Tax=Nocardia sp. NBC_00403 TaxID=2975990 RepID=UPI003FA54935
MLVEIQDALQHLRQYVPAGEPLERHIGAYATQMARAAFVKSSRGRASVGSVGAKRNLPDSRDVAAEFDHLVVLAREWPRVRSRAMVRCAASARVENRVTL